MFRTATRRAASATSSALRNTQQQQHQHQHIPLRPSHLKPTSTPLQTQRRALTYFQRLRRGYDASKKDIWRRNPILLPFAILSVITGAGIFGFVNYIELTQNVPQYSRYPDVVSERLRTAVYYTEIDLNPIKAAQAYQEALKLALENNMHPYCEEVIGIRLQTAMMLEKAGLVKASVQILEGLLAGTTGYVRSQRAAWGSLEKEMAVREEVKRIQEEEQQQQKKEDGPWVVKAKGEEFEDVKGRDRTVDQQEVTVVLESDPLAVRRLDTALRKMVGICMKLAALYASDYMQEEDKAQDRQELAVEISLTEMNRRMKMGLPVGGLSGGEDNWLSLADIATALTELAGLHVGEWHFKLAQPLYLRALDLVCAAEGDETFSPKRITLLSNIATCAAEHAMGEKTDGLFDAARKWARMALDAKAKVTYSDEPELRLQQEEECQFSCCSSFMTLGELSWFQQKYEDATAAYTKAKEIADGLGDKELQKKLKQTLEDVRREEERKTQEAKEKDAREGKKE